MPRLFWGNYGFESEIAGNQQDLPVQLRRLIAELACCWLSLADEGDRIWCPRPIDEEFFARMVECGLPIVRPETDVDDLPGELEFVPWGWSDTARAFAAGIGLQVAAPSSEVVRRANSRRFSLKQELDWGVAPSGVAAVESMTDLEDALRRMVTRKQRWVLKAEFSHAARERILGQGRGLTAHQFEWAKKRLQRDGILFFEPWFERCAEVGLQWTIPRIGRPFLNGVTPLLTDSFGQYRGSRFDGDERCIDDWALAVEISERAACELQRIGYFGPLGIDALRFRDAEGAESIRPLQDVNARWTMGRLSLGWRRIAASGTWRHGTQQQFRAAVSENPDQCLSTSPRLIDHDPVQHVTWLEFNN